MSRKPHPRVIIYGAPEGGYTAEVSSLPGYVARAETLEECLDQLEMVVDLWGKAAERAEREAQEAQAEQAAQAEQNSQPPSTADNHPSGEAG